MCIDDDEKTVEHHAKVVTVFGSSMLEKLTPGVKLTVTCHENAGVTSNYMLISQNYDSLPVACSYLQCCELNGSA